MSHAAIILTKVRDKLRPIYKDFIACYMTKVKTFQKNGALCEFICNEDFKNLIRDLLGDAVVEHEVVTLCRNFAVESKDSPRSQREAVRSIVQGEILRELWDDVERTKEFIHHFSPDNVNYLSEQKMLTLIRGCRIPIDIAIVHQMFAVLNRNEMEEIDVKDFLSFIDIKSCKAPPVPPVNPKVCEPFKTANCPMIFVYLIPQKNQFNFESEDESMIVDWKRFVACVDLEEELQIDGD